MISCLLATNVYNEMTKMAIQSILNQTYNDFELLILTNGDQNLRSLIEGDFTDPRIRIFYSPLQQLAHNLNTGLEHAAGKYIARMDADDIAHPQRFTTQVKILDKDPTIIVVSSIADFINEKGNIYKNPTKNRSLQRSEIIKSFWYRNPIIHPSVMFRKKEVIELGGYSEALNEDYALWLRIIEKYKEPFVIIPEKLISYRIHPNQSKGTVESYAFSCAITLREGLRTRNYLYLLGSFLFLIKLLMRGRRKA
jgi:glycosyltransferase involved in cell wall biosynthesis